MTLKCLLLLLLMSVVSTTLGMGTRSFVALPVEKGGSVARLSIEKALAANTTRFVTSMAYGLDAKQTILLGLPYRVSPGGNNRQGDLSVLYRRIVWQEDQLKGTNRFGFLGGMVLPTDSNRNAALQTGFVYTHFKERNEIDIDFLYQLGLQDRLDTGRYDISWQHRLKPAQRPEWGFSKEINSVLELNGRWMQGQKLTHQITVGLQLIHQRWVIEGSFVKDINNLRERRFLLSTRFHF